MCVFIYVGTCCELWSSTINSGVIPQLCCRANRRASCLAVPSSGWLNVRETQRSRPSAASTPHHVFARFGLKTDPRSPLQASHTNGNATRGMRWAEEKPLKVPTAHSNADFSDRITFLIPSCTACVGDEILAGSVVVRQARVSPRTSNLLSTRGS